MLTGNGNNYRLGLHSFASALSMVFNAIINFFSLYTVAITGFPLPLLFFGLVEIGWSFYGNSDCIVLRMSQPLPHLWSVSYEMIWSYNPYCMTCSKNHMLAHLGIENPQQKLILFLCHHISKVTFVEEEKVAKIFWNDLPYWNAFWMYIIYRRYW